MNIERIYARLLQLYPSDYRALFGAEMLGVFESVDEERQHNARAAYVRFVSCEFAGLVAGAARERIGHAAHAVYRSANLSSPLSLPAEWLASLTYVAFRSNPAFISRLVPDPRMVRTWRLSWRSDEGQPDRLW
jgi:hypothetical protein